MQDRHVSMASLFSYQPDLSSGMHIVFLKCISEEYSVFLGTPFSKILQSNIICQPHARRLSGLAISKLLQNLLQFIRNEPLFLQFHDAFVFVLKTSRFVTQWARLEYWFLLPPPTLSVLTCDVVGPLLSDLHKKSKRSHQSRWPPFSSNEKLLQQRIILGESCKCFCKICSSKHV